MKYAGIDGYIAIPNGILTFPNPLPAVTWEQTQRRLGPSAHAVYVLGKLKPGVTYEQAGAEMQAIYARFNSERPAYKREQNLDFVPLREKLARGERRSLVVLLAAVGFVLLIACANIANLLIARAVSRRRETAIRAAIGAEKLQLLRQALFESLLLALAGGVVGLLLARFCMRFLAGVVLTGGRQLGAVTIDGRVLWFTLAVALITGLLSGFGTAIPLWRADVSQYAQSRRGRRAWRIASASRAGCSGCVGTRIGNRAAGRRRIDAQEPVAHEPETGRFCPGKHSGDADHAFRSPLRSLAASAGVYRGNAGLRSSITGSIGGRRVMPVR